MDWWQVFGSICLHCAADRHRETACSPWSSSSMGRWSGWQLGSVISRILEMASSKQRPPPTEWFRARVRQVGHWGQAGAGGGACRAKAKNLVIKINHISNTKRNRNQCKKKKKKHDEQPIDILNTDGIGPSTWLIWPHSPHPNLGPSVLIQRSLKSHTSQTPFFTALPAIKMQISPREQHNKSPHVIFQCKVVYEMPSKKKKNRREAGKKTNKRLLALGLQGAAGQPVRHSKLKPFLSLTVPDWSHWFWLLTQPDLGICCIFQILNIGGATRTEMKVQN